MSTLKETVKGIPVPTALHALLRNVYLWFKLKRKNSEQVFTDIYKRNAWRGRDSASGTGSDAIQTKKILEELPNIFEEFKISSVLDIPCGDFHWMKNANLSAVDYLGADIVQDLVENNKTHYEKSRVRFQKINLIEDPLPPVDMIFCRDCLVHLSFDDIFRALRNVCRANSKYLFSTTFTRSAENIDILTGQWRVLNLQLAPFLLPSPLKIINENCTEENGIYSDKSLGLWLISDIQRAIDSDQRTRTIR